MVLALPSPESSTFAITGLEYSRLVSQEPDNLLMTQNLEVVRISAVIALWIMMFAGSFVPVLFSSIFQSQTIASHARSLVGGGE